MNYETSNMNVFSNEYLFILTINSKPMSQLQLLVPNEHHV
jgi:hypothetical protein